MDTTTIALATGTTLVIDETDDERPPQKLFRSDDFELRSDFAIDPTGIAKGTRFPRALQ